MVSLSSFEEEEEEDPRFTAPVGVTIVGGRFWSLAKLRVDVSLDDADADAGDGDGCDSDDAGVEETVALL